MTAAEYRQAVESLPYGKRLPGAVYLLDPGDDPRVPAPLRITVAELRKRLNIGPAFNLLKFHTASPKISFLSYPDFEANPHPALAESVIVDLVTGKTRRDDYRARANPPILHRKETFIPADHPLNGKFAKLTRQEEAVGLLEDTSRIGFRLNWEKLLAEKQLTFKGHRLIEAATPPLTASPQKQIHRHKTALVRRELSKPVKTLLELGQLRRGESFFDYGCGHGTDVDAIGKLGYDASGWDPVHAPDAPKQSADVVNLGFVLNVIEDPAERVDALIDAWHHIARTGAANPILAAAKFTGGFVATTAAGHEAGVHFPQQTVAEWKPLAKPSHAVFQGGDVIRDFHDIVEGCAGSFLQFKKQEIGERGLGALDLRREHGLAPHVGIEEKLGIREQGAHAVQSADRERGPFKQALPLAGKIQRRHGRQRRGHESPDDFPADGCGVVGASGVSLHAAKFEQGFGLFKFLAIFLIIPIQASHFGGKSSHLIDELWQQFGPRGAPRARQPKCPPRKSGWTKGRCATIWCKLSAHRNRRRRGRTSGHRQQSRTMQPSPGCPDTMC